LAGETEVLGEILPQCRFVHHKPHMLPVREPGPPRWEASVQPLELRHGLVTTFMPLWTHFSPTWPLWSFLRKNNVQASVNYHMNDTCSTQFIFLLLIPLTTLVENTKFHITLFSLCSSCFLLTNLYSLLPHIKFHLNSSSKLGNEIHGRTNLRNNEFFSTCI
jgi:hypothetical protein